MKYKDEEIISIILKKDENGINLLIDRYGGIIYGVLKEKLGKMNLMNDIEDIFYSVILKVWESTVNFDSTRGNYRNFIITIAKYTVIDYIRLKRLNEVSMEEYMINNISGTDELNTIIEKEAFDELIESLSNIDKEIFIKRYYFNDTIESISADIGKSTDYIYNRLSRGRKKIMSNIKEANGYERGL